VRGDGILCFSDCAAGAGRRAAAESAGRRQLNQDEEAELKSRWRKLVKLFHPDRVVGDDDKQATYQKLTAEINRARDAGDINRMREIANDPHGYIARQGWSSIVLDDSEESDKLRLLLESLEGQVISLIESIDALHGSPEYELHQLVASQPDLLAQVARKQSEALEKESAQLDDELARIELEIAEINAN